MERGRKNRDAVMSRPGCGGGGAVRRGLFVDQGLGLGGPLGPLAHGVGGGPRRGSGLAFWASFCLFCSRRGAHKAGWEGGRWGQRRAGCRANGAARRAEQADGPARPRPHNDRSGRGVGAALGLGLLVCKSREKASTRRICGAAAMNRGFLLSPKLSCPPPPPPQSWLSAAPNKIPGREEREGNSLLYNDVQLELAGWRLGRDRRILVNSRC